MACLLELMQYIFPQTSDASLVLDNLDTAQIITLHWGNTVAWAWEKWDDPRVIGFDAIMSMVNASVPVRFVLLILRSQQIGYATSTSQCS